MIYQILDKHPNWLVQFLYLLNLQEVRANLDYEGNNVSLPSSSFGAVTTNFWIQIKDPDDPGNAKTVKHKNSDYKAAKLEIIFVIK